MLIATEQRGHELGEAAAAAAAVYADKLERLKLSKMREMQLIIAKAEGKEPLKDLDRKQLLALSHTRAKELEQIDKERVSMRRRLALAGDVGQIQS
jgi:hypothetical protein